MKDISGALFAEARPSDSVASLRLGAVVREYLRFYAEGTTHTARAKQLDADKFLIFLTRFKRAKETDELRVSDWDFSATQRFVDESLRAGEAPATVARRLATLKHMGRILAERLPGFINPARDVKAPKQSLVRPQSIDAHEVREIREIARSRKEDMRSFTCVRNEAILNLLLDTGLRADEVRLLRPSQLDEDLGWIRKVRTKGRRFRDVYISTEMRPHLKEYLHARALELEKFYPKLTTSTDGKIPLFISSYGAQAADPNSFEMSPKTIWRAIRSYSIHTKLHPHLLRHTYATELLQDSKDIRLVAQALGHSDVRITMRYTERGNEEVAQALEKVRRGKRNGQ